MELVYFFSKVISYSSRLQPLIPSSHAAWPFSAGSYPDLVLSYVYFSLQSLTPSCSAVFIVLNYYIKSQTNLVVVRKHVLDNYVLPPFLNIRCSRFVISQT